MKSIIVFIYFFTLKGCASGKYNSGTKCEDCQVENCKTCDSATPTICITCPTEKPFNVDGKC